MRDIYKETIAKHYAEKVYESFARILKKGKAIYRHASIGYDVAAHIETTGLYGAKLTINYNLIDKTVNAIVKNVMGDLDLREYGTASLKPKGDPNANTLSILLRAYTEFKAEIIEAITEPILKNFGYVEKSWRLDGSSTDGLKKDAKEMYRICESIGFYPDYNGKTETQKRKLTKLIETNAGKIELWLSPSISSGSEDLKKFFSDEWIASRIWFTSQRFIAAIQDTLKELYPAIPKGVLK
jgi:hypothetical protein